MSKVLLIFTCFFLMGAVSFESIYTHSVTTIEGVNKPLTNYQGKKILVITLPVQQSSSNDSLLNSLDSLRAAYNGSLIIIATPSFEDGYTTAMKESLRQWYRSKLSMNIVVTEGLYTRKTSGSEQHSLFKWLTDKNLNSHFDKDVTGSKIKFVIWTNGQLIGVLGAHTKVGSNTINELLQ